MQKIIISKGNQYSQDGYHLESDIGLSAWGDVGPRMDGTIGLTQGGRWTLGVDYAHSGQAEAVEDAIRATIDDGVERVIVLQSKADVAPKVENDIEETPQRGIPGVTIPCPKCGSYCCGDCEAAGGPYFGGDPND